MGSLASPHVVVVTSITAGHAIPFLRFAKQLAAAGITVTFVSTDKHISELVAEHGIRDLTTTQAGLPLRFLELRDGKAHLSHRMFELELRKSQELQKTIQLLEELIVDVGSAASWTSRGVSPTCPPVCVLYDMFSAWAYEAARKLHIEGHLLYVSAVRILAIAFQSERLLREGRLPVTDATAGMVITDIPGLPPTMPMDLPSTVIHPDTYKWIHDHHLRFPKSNVILDNSFYDLEKTVVDAFRTEVLGTAGVETEYVLEVGPLLPESHFADSPSAETMVDHLTVAEPNACIRWLNTQAPSSVLYICFGSAATHPLPQLLELALGLEASDQPFLWILRPPNAPPISEASGTPTSITEFLPPGFEERIRGRGMCYSGWAPQTQILKHPATGGFLSHCGWNSVLESVCAGVPMLGWPSIAEQHLNARFSVDTVKLAIEVPRGARTIASVINPEENPAPLVTKEVIEHSVRMLMQEDEGFAVRENMQKMKTSARKAVQPGGTSRRNMETYISLLHMKAAALMRRLDENRPLEKSLPQM